MSALEFAGPEGTTLASVAVPKTYEVDPQIQNVAVLVALGVLGTLLNVALFAGALTRSRIPGSLGCAPPLSAALAQFAFGGLIESTMSMILAAAYSGGGLTSTSMNPNEISHPAKSALLASLFFVSSWYAWTMTSVMAASVPGASLGLVRFLILVGGGASIAVGAATGYFVGKDKANISSTVLVPRLKLVVIPEALRWSIVGVAFALPWVLWLLFAILAAAKSMSKKPAAKVFHFASETPPSTAAIVSTLVILYVGLRVPYEILSLLQGPRPPTLHSAITWARFAFSVAAPFMILGSARKFKAALIAAFVCCAGRRKRAVSPPDATEGDPNMHSFRNPGIPHGKSPGGAANSAGSCRSRMSRTCSRSDCPDQTDPNLYSNSAIIPPETPLQPDTSVWQTWVSPNATPNNDEKPDGQQALNN